MIGALIRTNSTDERAKARRLFVLLPLSLVLSMFVSTALYADDGGKVMGTVKDQSGAVVPNAEVDLTSKSTGVSQNTKTDSEGAYTFPLVPVGTYMLAVRAAGFNPVEHDGLVINIHSVVEQDSILAVGDQTQTVTVNDSETQVETAETELGETLGSEKITSVPLNGRSYTDLLSVQSGVTPISTSASQSGSSGGSFASATAPSGGLDPGQFSISGQRESANGFVLNGASVVEGIASAAAVIPNLDSIAEFRILTTNSDAEFGNYSGGLVNVVTKSGTNQLHGSAFEFLRNTDLDAKGYFDSERPAYIQNQFGGTLGGPLRHDKVFFFIDYQGNRTVQGIETAQIPVPSVQDRNGNLSDVAAFNGSVSDAYFASQLSQRIGYPVAVGSPYYTSGCTSTTQCVFPNGIIPRSAWSAPAKYLLQYIPQPTGLNNAGPYFQTAANNERLNDDKGSARVDANTHYGNLSAYYFIDGYNLNNPYAISQGGANVPGFGILSNGLAQLIALSDIKSIGDKMVNEAHLSYLRNANDLGQPHGGLGVSPTEQGFASASQGGFLPQLPAQEGVVSVNFNNYTIGTSPFTVLQINNTYEVSDTFSRVVGNHTVKVGADAHKDHVKQVVNLQSNGQFNFYGNQTGDDFADFLLGVPSQFVQGYTPPFGDDSSYVGLFAQDSWKARPNVVVNYGLRWEYMRPWSEQHGQTAALIPGENSEKFPGAPEGLVFPGDPGVPSTVARTPMNDFSPRIGVAYSPNANGTVFHRLLGDSGKSSVRAGFGRYFTAIEGATLSFATGDSPWGLTYVSTEPPLFESPFIGAQTGTRYAQPFPVAAVPYSASPKQPYQVDWAQYEPINGVDSYYYKNRTPYSENYYLALQRQLTSNVVLTVNYTGSEGHHLITLLSANPGNPALCLSVSQTSQVAPGSPTCGPFGENETYTKNDGTVINGTRAPFGNTIGSSAYFYNYGNSAYNSLQVTVNYTGKQATFLGGYTYGKSIDDASSFQEQLYPYDYDLRRSISSFDLRHSFVASYRYSLPFDQMFKANRLSSGWSLTGITRFSTGVPVTLFDFNDNSLIGAGNNGVNGVGVDLPDVTPGPLQINHNPRNGSPYFNTALFQVAPLGSPGDAKRRFFYGPGIDNWDLALLKAIAFTESRSLEFRLETFNAFNHTQFDGASSVNGNFTSSSFGQVTSAASPRIAQIAAKFSF
jgi:Carboxypeptidase regulatory-like domain